MMRSVVCSTDSIISPVMLGPLHITGHNSSHLAVFGLQGLGIKRMRVCNGRAKDQLRAVLTRSPQENISGADPGNQKNPLATEQRDGRDQWWERTGCERVYCIDRRNSEIMEPSNVCFGYRSQHKLVN